MGEELEEQIGKGKRRCVCTEEYYCNTCRELEQLEKQAESSEIKKENE